MKHTYPTLKCIVAAFFVAVAPISQAQAGDAELDALFEQLALPDLPDWEKVEKDIWEEWSRSGSDAMDLLLNRGREAMQAGDSVAAIEHFSALIDHAPDFAEGWNARASAFFGIEEYGLSIADIEQTLRLNPRHFGAMQGLGRMLEDMGEPENALKAYQAAIAIHPHRPNLKSAVERLEVEISGQDI